MNRTRKAINALLAGATLLRSRKHKVYKLPNGATYVESSTPSDQRSDKNALSTLKHRLEIPTNGGQVGERREKRRTQPRVEPVKYEKFNNTLAEQLSLSGAKEAALREEIEGLQDELRMLEYHREIITAELVEARMQIASCWFCRFKKAVGW